MGRRPRDTEGNGAGTLSAGGGDFGKDTRLVGAGRRADWTGPVVNPPVWRASTHLYPDTAALKEGGRTNEDGRFFYGRRGAPTQWALADALTELEPGAAGTVLYPSGVAAIAGALMAVLKPGDVLLVTDNAYEPSRIMAGGILARMGVEARFFAPLDLESFAAQFCDRTKAVLLESPGSLTMEVCDVPALAAIARDHGAVSLIDNTWASSLGFPALERGCDIAIMSLTKHVGGHSDLMMGPAPAPDRAGAGPGGLARRCRSRAARAEDDGRAAGEIRRHRTGALRMARHAARCRARAVPDAPRCAGARTVAARLRRRLRTVQFRPERP